jgi:hypothetical protein
MIVIIQKIRFIGFGSFGRVCVVQMGPMVACLKIVEKSKFQNLEFETARSVLLKTKSVNIMESYAMDEVPVDNLVYVALLLEYGNGGGFWNCLSFAVEFFF